MIYVVSGKLGGGKSLYCAHLAAMHMARGGFVCSNCSYDTSAMSDYAVANIKPWQFLRIDTKGFKPTDIPIGDYRGSKNQRKVLVVIDEALNWFSSSNARDDEKKSVWGEWLRQSDKLGLNESQISRRFTLPLQ